MSTDASIGNGSELETCGGTLSFLCVCQPFKSELMPRSWSVDDGQIALEPGSLKQLLRARCGGPLDNEVWTAVRVWVVGHGEGGKPEECT